MRDGQAASRRVRLTLRVGVGAGVGLRTVVADGADGVDHRGVADHGVDAEPFFGGRHRRRRRRHHRRCSPPWGPRRPPAARRHHDRWLMPDHYASPRRGAVTAAPSAPTPTAASATTIAPMTSAMAGTLSAGPPPPPPPPPVVATAPSGSGSGPPGAPSASRPGAAASRAAWSLSPALDVRVEQLGRMIVSGVHCPRNQLEYATYLGPMPRYQGPCAMPPWLPESGKSKYAKHSTSGSTANGPSGAPVAAAAAAAAGAPGETSRPSFKPQVTPSKPDHEALRETKDRGEKDKARESSAASAQSLMSAMVKAVPPMKTAKPAARAPATAAATATTTAGLKLETGAPASSATGAASTPSAAAALSAAAASGPPSTATPPKPTTRGAIPPIAVGFYDLRATPQPLATLLRTLSSLGMPRAPGLSHLPAPVLAYLMNDADDDADGEIVLPNPFMPPDGDLSEGKGAMTTKQRAAARRHHLATVARHAADRCFLHTVAVPPDVSLRDYAGPLTAASPLDAASAAPASASTSAPTSATAAKRTTAKRSAAAMADAVSAAAAPSAATTSRTDDAASAAGKRVKVEKPEPRAVKPEPRRGGATAVATPTAATAATAAVAAVATPSGAPGAPSSALGTPAPVAAARTPAMRAAIAATTPSRRSPASDVVRRTLSDLFKDVGRAAKRAAQGLKESDRGFGLLVAGLCFMAAEVTRSDWMAWTRTRSNDPHVSAPHRTTLDYLQYIHPPLFEPTRHAPVCAYVRLLTQALQARLKLFSLIETHNRLEDHLGDRGGGGSSSSSSSVNDASGGGGGGGDVSRLLREQLAQQSALMVARVELAQQVKKPWPGSNSSSSSSSRPPPVPDPRLPLLAEFDVSPMGLAGLRWLSQYAKDHDVTLAAQTELVEAFQFLDRLDAETR
ncbi:hypothetical protein CXG81DRAFT_16886 [Caulochytrium protostelioides]|uniref:Uncharacterized protein n=1 Tax=Caulochytrium protostelioides TaxID=1555241 RepID=A0A4P9XDQ4_9FUNG|nr:hypothetical protein CXG81DRAFT_16886 [Caulochytrium protostelioides]|eukprot:RKP03654.1 hypothetical protein CXG81DRAFT_16886 [Caulochytrium protostelioides]